MSPSADLDSLCPPYVCARPFSDLVGVPPSCESRLVLEGRKLWLAGRGADGEGATQEGPLRYILDVRKGGGGAESANELVKGFKLPRLLAVGDDIVVAADSTLTPPLPMPVLVRRMS